MISVVSRYVVTARAAAIVAMNRFVPLSTALDINTPY